MGTNTGLGIGIGIPFKNNALGGDKPYFPPELKARMIGVWTNYGKKNTDADRNIIKNKIPNAGGDLEILNAAYKLNSGFGEYKVDFLDWTINSPFINERTSFTFSSFNDTNNDIITVYQRVPAVVQSFKIKAKLRGRVLYRYYVNNGDTISVSYYEVKEGINILPDSADPTSVNGKVGFVLKGLSSIKVELIPNFEDAFVTDGINDIIVSQKTLQEMGVTKELTIVSMIHQISFRNSASVPLTNYIRPTDNIYARNQIADIGKTGIYGYVVYDIKNSTVGNSHIVNTILGDKNDYSINIVGDLSQGKFSVQGYIDDNGNIFETSSVAHYWTFAVLGKATEDEINLIIGNYNLDRSLKPDILCNIGKQGITNDNHAEFNDKLIDYSGNGRDIQMYNLAWKGGSGVAAKPYETFKDWTSESYSTSIITQIDEFTRIVESTTNGYWVSRIRRDSDLDKVYDAINVYLYQDNNFLVHECKYEVDGIKHSIPINESVGKGYHKLEMYTKDRYTELPENAENVVLSEWYFPKSTKGSIKYSIIPSCKGGILLDGINDFGKVIDMPIYKDYTFIIDREIISIGNIFGIVASKSESDIDITKQGAFLFEYLGAPNNITTWSFYNDNHKVGETDFTKSISYQSKYSYNGVKLLAGTALDSDKLWLGTLRDKDSRFANVAIYSLMSFPYSMSEFLIERQLKKHKLGTLYPNMVEFRPVIKANANYKITYYQIDSTNTWKSIKVGDYIVIGAKLAFQITFDNDASELKEVVSPQLSGIIVEKRPSNPGYNIYSYITSKSPQKINITIDEYIRFEDIVQPYPVLLRFKDENGNEVSWGGKFRVGSTITRIGSAADSNLLPNIYNIFGLLLNGNQVTSSKVIVEKTMVFKAKSAYIFDNNEPKCILSPSRLRMPNSSYKILGYIPDISGHGNNGKINNSAYKLNSGVNGYLVDFTTLKDDGIKGIVRTDSKIYLDKSFNYNQGFWLGRTNNPSPAYKVKVSGIPETGMLTYTGGVWLNLVNGINELPARTNTEEEHGFVIQSPNLDWSNLVIEQIGEYEGAYCFDGVDDFVTIPTTVGGKQVLMKVNWQSAVGKAILYDQRGNNNEFAIYNGTTDSGGNPIPAYQGRNDGQTYIDGILNKNINTSELRTITHNITITNELSLGANKTYPVIGTNKTVNSYYANMALYDFMLFDNISTDDKIKELNEYIGIEAKVELPPYYWDAYGKTNLDADKATIQQRGTAVGDYDLTNYNHAYDKMSGYGGYKFAKFDNELDWNLVPDNGYIDVVSRNGYSITLRNLSTLSYGWYFKNSTVKEFITKDIPFKVKANKSIRVYWDMHSYNSNGENFGHVVNYITLKPNKDAFINLRHLTEEELTELGANKDRMYYLLWFDLSTLAVDEEVTIEMLPLYPNGLAYDGITDYSKNANIPVLTDYTYIYKRTIINIPTNAATLLKGADKTNGGAFIADYGNKWQFNFGQYNTIQSIADGINWQTVNSFNGTPINKGENTDDSGITVAKFSNEYTSMVFYKLILYPKTISLLEINFLKNLMEKDEIIDLNNPIFIKNE